MLDRHTWESQIQVDNKDQMMTALRSAGLPLAHGGDTSLEESENSKTTYIISYVNNQIKAIAATPSGLVFRFEPSYMDDGFWRFVLTHHYVVTGNMVDRQMLLDDLDLSTNVSGRLLIRKKSEEPSGLLLDEMLANLGLPSSLLEDFNH